MEEIPGPGDGSAQEEEDQDAESDNIIFPQTLIFLEIRTAGDLHGGGDRVDRQNEK